jgi:uncharacterized ion transporter superfamily protein YfcC
MAADTLEGAQAPTVGRMPGTLVILGTILLLAALATLFLPRGEYARETRTLSQLKPHVVAEGETLDALLTATGAPAETPLEAVLDAGTLEPVAALVPGTRVLVPRPGLTRDTIVPNTYRRLNDEDPRSFGEKVSVAARAVALAPISGFEARASVIGFVLMIGAAFGVLLATGSIDRALVSGVTTLGDGRARLLVVPASIFLFSACGATFGMGESTIAFVLVTIPLAIRMGYDTLTGITMCYLASQVGFAGAFFNPFTIGVATSIAELPYPSALGFRVVSWFIVTATAALFAMWWAARVKRDPSRSPTAELDARWRERLEGGGHGHTGLSLRDWSVVLVALGTLVFSGVGVAVWDWYITEMAALFVVAGVLGGFLGGFGTARIASELKDGAATMVEPALIIALSAGVLQVLEAGQVLDTVLMALAAPLEQLSQPVAATLIMCGQAIVNFFVPSGSGQAALTMPVMTPLCDILAMDRQVGVLAFQFGDGFGNMLIPTSAVLMGVLGAARVQWSVWVRWVWKLILLLHVIAAILLVVALNVPQAWLR